MTAFPPNARTWAISVLRRGGECGPLAPGVLTPGTRPRTLARTAARTARDGGAVAVVRGALAFAGVRRVVIFHRPTAVTHADVRRVSDVGVGEVTEERLEAYRALRGDTSLAEARRRLRAGDVCLGAWRGDRLLSVRWLARDRAEIPYLRVACPLGSGVRYGYDAFTEPTERRNRLGIIVGDALTRRAGADGARSVISAVLPENRGGMALAPGRGAFLGTVGTVLLGRRLIVARNVPGGYLGDPRPL